jgi:hypothetical protein
MRFQYCVACIDQEIPFNRFSRHHHCDSPNVRRERLARAGLSLVEWRYYFSKAATGAMDASHVGAYLLLVCRKTQ